MRWTAVLDPRVMKTCKKVNKLLLQAYERRDEAWVAHPMRYRGHRLDLPGPLLRQLLQLAGQLPGASASWWRWRASTSPSPWRPRTPSRPCWIWPVCTSAWSCASHTNGGYQSTCWTSCGSQCEAVERQHHHHVSARVPARPWPAVQGLLDEQGRERGYHLIWIEHDLMDPRTVSRQDHARQGQRVYAHGDAGRACGPHPAGL